MEQVCLDPDCQVFASNIVVKRWLLSISGIVFAFEIIRRMRVTQYLKDGMDYGSYFDR